MLVGIVQWLAFTSHFDATHSSNVAHVDPEVAPRASDVHDDCALPSLQGSSTESPKSPRYPTDTSLTAPDSHGLALAPASITVV